LAGVPQVAGLEQRAQCATSWNAAAVSGRSLKIDRTVNVVIKQNVTIFHRSSAISVSEVFAEYVVELLPVFDQPVLELVPLLSLRPGTIHGDLCLTKSDYRP